MSIHYEPISHIELLQGIHDSYCVSYNGMPFAEKDFHISTQFFVRRVCKYGLSAIESFEKIDQVTKKVSGNGSK